MSCVVTQPESLAAAARLLSGVGSAMAAHNAAAAPPTTRIIPSPDDDVCALTAKQFAIHAQTYQQAHARTAVVHQVFKTTLAISAGGYAAAEATCTVAAG